MMIYMVVVIFLIIWLMNYLMYRDVFAPTSVMCLVWGITLTLVSVYQSGFFEISNESLLGIMSGVIAFFIGGLISIPLSKISLPNYKKVTYKLATTVGVSFLVLFFLSLIVLNKLSNGDGIIESATSSIGNYIIANVFAFDSLKFNPIPSDLCANNDPSCTFLPFYDVGIFHTNVYTFLYDYMSYGWVVFSLSLLLIGFFHNMLHTMGRKTKNPVVIIISALLYSPLVYQVINDQCFSSKYLVYL